LFEFSIENEMGNQTSAFLTMAAFARLHGVAKPTVTGWKRRGLLVFARDGKRIDVAASNARLAARPSISRGGVTKVRPGSSPERISPGSDGSAPAADAADPTTWSRQEALRQREIAQARLAQIEADRAAGLVVPIAEVADAVRGEYAIVRTGLLGMASKLAHRLAVATTPEACGALVDAEARSILETLTADAPK
jgi:hypothetical protein